MINEEQIINATDAYLISYNTAMNRTKNPNFSAQVAAIITMSVYQSERNNKQNQPSTGDIFLAEMMHLAQMCQEKKPEEETDDDERP